ncbi:MAG: kumamolisin [Chlamydiales bacterium]|jgi:kumamolisin
MTFTSATERPGGGVHAHSSSLLVEAATESHDKVQNTISPLSNRTISLLDGAEVARNVVTHKRNPMHSLKAIPNSSLPRMTGATMIGSPAEDDHVEVTLHLRYRESHPELPTMTEAHGKPQTERVTLSAEEFARIYGADKKDIKLVEKFSHAHGLSIVEASAGERIVVLSGTAKTINKAFGVSLKNYSHSNGEYRGHSGPVHLPESLHGIIEGVFGLDTRPVFQPKFRFASESQTRERKSFLPTDLSKIYNFPKDSLGKGQSIAIIELGGGYDPEVLTKYFTEDCGLETPPNVTSVSVAGGKNDPDGPTRDADGEVYLDIEVIGAVAPEADIVVYFAPNTTEGFLRAVKKAAHDPLHDNSVISISWGSPEAVWNQRDSQNNPYRTSFDQAFKEAATVRNVSVCVAAGDAGASDERPHQDNKANVDFPSASPYVLSCGGTKLEAADHVIKSEVVWNNVYGGATGGGISELEERPSYQNAVHMPVNVNTGKDWGRGVPDVSGVADPSTGYEIRLKEGMGVIGGTSAVAPLWAGLIAQLNQKMDTRLGFLNPQLYQIGESRGAFHDITQGDNEVSSTPGYKATEGWDACTGWGSPNGENLATALQAVRHTSPAVTSDESWRWFGWFRA